jgi:hypothetical protein
LTESRDWQLCRGFVTYDEYAPVCLVDQDVVCFQLFVRQARAFLSRRALQSLDQTPTAWRPLRLSRLDQLCTDPKPDPSGYLERDPASSNSAFVLWQSKDADSWREVSSNLLVLGDIGVGSRGPRTYGVVFDELHVSPISNSFVNYQIGLKRPRLVPSLPGQLGWRHGDDGESVSASRLPCIPPELRSTHYSDQGRKPNQVRTCRRFVSCLMCYHDEGNVKKKSKKSLH